MLAKVREILHHKIWSHLTVTQFGELSQACNQRGSDGSSDPPPPTSTRSVFCPLSRKLQCPKSQIYKSQRTLRTAAQLPSGTRSFCSTSSTFWLWKALF